MKNNNSNAEDEIELPKLLMKLLNNNLKYLHLVNADPSLIQFYQSFISGLRCQGERGILDIIEGGKKNKRSTVLRKDNQLSDQKLQAIGMDDVDTLIHENNISRGYLDRVAMVRFGMTTGELSAITNRARLIEQLEALMSNERTHEAIRRRAGNQKKE